MPRTRYIPFHRSANSGARRRIPNDLKDRERVTPVICISEATEVPHVPDWMICANVAGLEAEEVCSQECFLFAYARSRNKEGR